ncbi:MAG: hypothetical protein SFU99_10465 [Saprospiraceae bacterium]|nr:hypothetical protein [Saprospiraceae bacterium]
MTTTNKKVAHTMDNTSENSNLDAFLSYYAYDVRWYIIGGRNAKNKKVVEQFLKDIEEETYTQIEVNHTIGESNSKFIKNI